MQALNTELANVTSQIEKLSFYRDKLTNLVEVAKQANAAPVVRIVNPVESTEEKRGKYKRKGAALPKQKVDKIAGFVAHKVRATGCSKAEAIELAIDKYNLPAKYKKRLFSLLSPSQMGHNAYNTLFSGTRYA